MKLRSKTGMITGGNTGIGLATAQLFIGGLSGTMLGGQIIKAGIDAARDGQRSGQ
jgi:NAD(P)-dependent dehydrogenase (short-subunit alcohol dehydrogenase family)